MKFSVVIPVYNRPDEINNLIQSITNQSFKDLEVIVVEDGSILSSEKTIDKFKKNISLKYYNKKNEGPGLARNFGSKFALGEWIIEVNSVATYYSLYTGDSCVDFMAGGVYWLSVNYIDDPSNTVTWLNAQDEYWYTSTSDNSGVSGRLGTFTRKRNSIQNSHT